MGHSRLETALMGKSSGGRTQYVRYLKGDRLTQRQAIIAKCYECMGYYVDGRRDCKMSDCPLYPFMPYRGSEETSTDSQE